MQLLQYKESLTLEKHIPSIRWALCIAGSDKVAEQTLYLTYLEPVIDVQDGNI